MKSISIKGTFSSPANNSVIIEIYRPNVMPHRFSIGKTFTKDFVLSTDEPEDNTKYYIDVDGSFSENFTLEITGDFDNPNPIKKTFKSNTVSQGYEIKTKK